MEFYARKRYSKDMKTQGKYTMVMLLPLDGYVQRNMMVIVLVGFQAMMLYIKKQ